MKFFNTSAQRKKETADASQLFLIFGDLLKKNCSLSSGFYSRQMIVKPGCWAKALSMRKFPRCLADCFRASVVRVPAA